MANDFTGMRKVAIRNTATGGTGDFSIFGPDKISSDGLTISMETNELTIGSYAGDIVTDNGTNLSAVTLSLIPGSMDDMAAIFPDGYNATTGSWQPPIGGCTSKDATVVFDKVCDTKGNVIMRHASVATAFEASFTRDDVFMVEVSIYMTLSPGSEYQLTGADATKVYPFQMYNGTYDPATDEVTFDTVTPPAP